MDYSNSKKGRQALGLRLLPLQCTLVLLLSSIATCDVDKDKLKCGDELVGLATCLPYVSGESKTPPIDCCAGLKQVLHKSPECICLLVKDRNDPSLGLKINATLALTLPSQCHAPANVSHCPGNYSIPPYSVAQIYSLSLSLYVCMVIGLNVGSSSAALATKFTRRQGV